MRKSLITGVLALAATAYIVTSCSRDEFSGDVIEAKKQAFDNVFKSEFGNPATDQDWGFGDGVTRGMRRSNNPGVDYPATSTGINANANEWADNTSGKTFGGWVVPDPLTPEQKEVVRKYFQAVPNLTYEDPHYRHFFVQQVYTGGTEKPSTGNKETNVAAGGQSYTSANMNLLTVGYNEQHINNFNAGSYSGQAIQVDGQTINPNSDGTVNVLDNGYTVNQFAEHHHKDQIMLMVNIDDTECMGYHNTGSSQQRNDKAALVGWEVIRTWANGQGLNGNCLNDGWNRSFVGFDFELYSLEDSYYKENGNKVYAKFTDGQKSSLQYVWDGENVLKKGPRPASAQKRAAKRRTGETSVTLWSGNEQISNNNAKDVSFSDEAKKLLVAGNYLGLDLSVITKWDWGTYNDWRVSFNGSWGAALGSGVITLNSTSTNAEIRLTDNDISIISQQGLRVWSISNPVNFTRIYISDYSQANAGGGGDDNQGGGDDNQGSGDDNQGGGDDNQGGEGDSYDYYESDYLIVNGEQIPFLDTNMNMYSGVLYGGHDEALSDADMTIVKDGKECFNMAKIEELVEAGYLPVKNKNLRTWVKWQGGDGYFSDWIVTLAKADRISDLEETNEEEMEEDYLVDQGRVFCEDLGQVSNRDLDYNDVVFDAWVYYKKVYRRTKTTVKGVTTYGEWVDQNADSPSRTVIKLLAAGGTLPIQVAGEDVHKKMGNISTGTMINTVTEASITLGDMNPDVDHVESIDPVEFTSPTAYSSIIEIPILVKNSNSVYELTAYQGQSPQKFKAPVGTPWPAERCELKNAFPTFENWVGDRNNLPWSNQNETYLYGAGN